MKKINYFPVLSLLAGVLAATLFFSCAKNEVADPGDSIQNPIVDTEPDGEGSEPEIPDDPTLIPQEGEMTEDGRPVVMLFGARIGDDEEEPEADSESTKTYLGTPSDGKYPNYWSVGDQVKINDTPSATLPSENIYKGGKQARFPMAEVVSKYNGNWYVGYPAAQFSFSNGTGTVTVPSVQTYVSGSYDPSAYILLGKSGSQSVRFYPKMAVVRFTPQDADPSYGSNIKSVRIEAIGNDAMSGQFTTDYNNESASFAPVDGQSYPYVQINAPDQASGLAFGTQFFFLIPAKTYASGIRFVITTVDDKSMSVSKAGAYTASVSETSTIKPPKYVPSTVTLTCPFKTSSSLGFVWSGSNASNNNNYKKVWRLAVYSDSGCNTLVVQHDIPDDGDKTGVWKGLSANGSPQFIVGGLNPGTTYYCKVTDLANNVSTVESFTTDSFTVVQASSPSGNTLLAEDFSEFGWGPAYLGGNSAANRYSGWSPVSGASSNVSLAAPTGVVSSGYYKDYTYSANNLPTNFDYTTAPRFNAGFGYCYDGTGFNGYPQAGHLRMGGANANRVFLVCPSLKISEGKFATVDVTVKVARFQAGDITNNETFAVFLESGLTLSNASQRMYTGASLNRRYPISLTEYGHNSQELTFRVNGVSSTDHLMIGCYNNVNTYNRFTLYSVKVERVGDEVSTETFDITDDVSLRTFYARVSGGEKSLDANVWADVTASSTTADAWTPLGTPKGTDEGTSPYTGTFEGNDKTISGLTSAFFNDVTGTVQNLTLNSTINMTTDAYEGTAIFANYLMGSGQIKDCISKGSVRYCPSTAVTGATRYVSGMVGSVMGGLMTRCTNYASVSVPHNSKDNDMQLEVGGVIARLASSTACSYLHNVYDNSIGGANSGKISVAIHHDHDDGGDAKQCRVGGVIGYITTGGRPISYCTNSGAVEYSGTSFGALKVGGIVGYARRGASNCQNSGNVTITDAAAVTRGPLYLGGLLAHYETNDNLSNSSNSGTISNGASTSGDDIDVGGLVGKSARAISSCYNDGTVANSGNSGADVCLGGVAGNWQGGTMSGSYNLKKVENTSGGTGKYIYVGGVSGYSKNSSWSSCSNRAGAVSNAAAADSLICVGGVAALAFNDSGTVSFTSCYNTGAVSNTGFASNVAVAPMHVSVAGLVAYANGTVDLSSANYNNGPVTESSTSIDVAVAGVCGYANNASTTLAGCENRINGTVNLENNSRHYPYVAGILGVADASLTLTSASNAGAINVKSVSANIFYVGGIVAQIAGDETVLNISGTSSKHTSNSGTIKFKSCTYSAQLRFGGIIGCYDNEATATIQYCTNSGKICTDTESKSSTDLTPASTGVAFSYIGGIAGMAGGSFANKTITNCVNSGNIHLFTSGKLRIGGICSYTVAATTLSNCTCNASIKYGRTSLNGVSTVGNASNIGGIVAYAGGSNTLSNLHFSGTIDASDSYNYCYVGGILGCINESTTTFSGCSVRATLTSCGTTNYDPGLYMCTRGTTKRSVSFTNSCKVGISSVNGTSITSLSNVTQNLVVGGGHTGSSIANIEWMN